MNLRAIEKLLDEEGVVICTCKVCRNKMRLEPDAQTGYCDRCGAVRDVRNPLIEAGMI